MFPQVSQRVCKINIVHTPGVSLHTPLLDLADLRKQVRTGSTACPICDALCSYVLVQTRTPHNRQVVPWECHPLSQQLSYSASDCC